MVLYDLVSISVKSSHDGNDFFIGSEMAIKSQECLDVAIVQESIMRGINNVECSIGVPVIPPLHLNLDALHLEMKVDLSLHEICKSSLDSCGQPSDPWIILASFPLACLGPQLEIVARQDHLHELCVAQDSILINVKVVYHVLAVP